MTSNAPHLDIDNQINHLESQVDQQTIMAGQMDPKETDDLLGKDGD